MADEQPAQDNDLDPSAELTGGEAEAVGDTADKNPRVLHEIIRLQGEEELRRPVLSLILSAFAAGVAICASLLAQAAIQMRLPAAPASELVSGFGYALGFVIVILGNLQLFTETTITAVLPVAAHPGFKVLWRLLRLWTIVLVGNLAGTLLVAAAIAHSAIIAPEQRQAAIEIASHLLTHGPGESLLIGIPAGFLIASIAWTLPNARGSAFWVVLFVTYIVAIGGFSHVVVGSSEAWLLWQTGRASLGWVVGGFLLPVLAGNIIGGTGLFAVLAHGQVHNEL